MAVSAVGSGSGAPCSDLGNPIFERSFAANQLHGLFQFQRGIHETLRADGRRGEMQIRACLGEAASAHHCPEIQKVLIVESTRGNRHCFVLI